MDWEAMIIPLASGLFSILVAVVNNKSSVKKEDSNHANILFEQYKERVIMLQDDVVEREKRIRENQDAHEVEMNLIKDKMEAIEELNAKQKQEIFDLDFENKKLKKLLLENGIEF